MTDERPAGAEELREQARAMGVVLTPAESRRLLAYLEAMLEENAHVNLTGIRDRAQAQSLHVLDSVAARLLPLEFERAVDLGTGNGFPGAAVGILWPDAEVTLVDRTEKKVRAIGKALSRAAEVLRQDAGALRTIRTAAGDATHAKHQLPQLYRSCDLVTARAVSTPEKVAELAIPLTQPGAWLLLWLGPKTESAAELPGRFTKQTEAPYELPGDRHHRLALYRRT